MSPMGGLPGPQAVALTCSNIGRNIGNCSIKSNVFACSCLVPFMVAFMWGFILCVKWFCRSGCLRLRQLRSASADAASLSTRETDMTAPETLVCDTLGLSVFP